MARSPRQSAHSEKCHIAKRLSAIAADSAYGPIADGHTAAPGEAVGTIATPSATWQANWAARPTASDSLPGLYQGSMIETHYRLMSKREARRALLRQSRRRLPFSPPSARPRSQAPVRLPPAQIPKPSPASALPAATCRQGWCKHPIAARPPTQPLPVRRSPSKSAPALPGSTVGVAHRPLSTSYVPCCAASLAHKADLAESAQVELYSVSSIWSYPQASKKFWRSTGL
jgi:hypothetical protein